MRSSCMWKLTSSQILVYKQLLRAVRYGGEHKAPELQKEAVYGLTEIHREEIKGARLVANPGCYPTSVQLPLIPLLQVT